jgi:hypothetical protein
MSNNTSNSEHISLLDHKGSLLFILIGGFFIANGLVAEFVGVKIFSLEKSFGFDPLNIDIGGVNVALNLSAGALLWPLEFAIADIINEYFGKRGIKVLSYITVILICYAFLIIWLTMQLTPADFWITRDTSNGPVNMVIAFDVIFSQGLWIIIGSLVAFLIGQIVDVGVFFWIKSYTGERLLWLRATGSTFISQLVDSFVVLLIAFYFNPATNWDLDVVLVMGVVKYVYKLVMAIALTPLIYLLHYTIDTYLGQELAEEIKKYAHEK